MDLQVLVSQKGTRVVTATNLYQVLGLSDSQYAGNIKKWIADVYAFEDGVRKPTPLKDYAKRPLKNNGILKDFYLSLEFAKLITLQSNSKYKFKYAQWLQAQQENGANLELLSKEDVVTAIDLAKNMCAVSYQLTCERQHFELYKSRNGGSAANWWRHRQQVIGQNEKSLRTLAFKLGKELPKENLRTQLLALDPLDLVRIGTIDLFLALGKSLQYAQKMGELTKLMAQKLKLSILDDTNSQAPDSNKKIKSHLLQKVVNKESQAIAKRA